MKNCITTHEPGIYCHWFDVIAEYEGKVVNIQIRTEQASTYSDAVTYMSEHWPGYRCICIESAKPISNTLSLAC